MKRKTNLTSYLIQALVAVTLFVAGAVLTLVFHRPQGLVPMPATQLTTDTLRIVAFPELTLKDEHVFIQQNESDGYEFITARTGPAGETILYFRDSFAQETLSEEETVDYTEIWE